MVAVIPARYASTRFPGKILADETGHPLIEHVHQQVTRATTPQRVIIATDDQRIAQAAMAFDAAVTMTRPDHPNGTSRLAEVAEGLDCDVVVNVQGDEPEIDPAVIDLAVETLLDHPECSVATVASPFADGDDPTDPNLVKVVLDTRGRALYFSRSPIPANMGEYPTTPLKHVGLYVYRRDFLDAYVTLSPTPLEQSERLEQLRVLEHGYSIGVAVTECHHHGIDTPEQYAAFVQRWNAAQLAGQTDR